ncbi:hypothetical protein BBSC_1631 [Bifidobacterium scardovii JCM 12489 = DSM 13734]|nr:hypothetical protein BBSC_1631 [Bifidobacterium scardovii JCM 12489 = DSM 13734]
MGHTLRCGAARPLPSGKHTRSALPRKNSVAPEHGSHASRIVVRR